MGAYSLIHQEFQMPIIINSWIPLVLIENQDNQKLSFCEQTAIKTPLIIYSGQSICLLKRFAACFSVVKTQDFSNLITKQSNNLINLEITFLTITASKMRRPVQHHQVKYRFDTLLVYQPCSFPLGIVELITYPMPDHYQGFRYQVRDSSSNTSSVKCPSTQTSRSQQIPGNSRI